MRKVLLTVLSMMCAAVTMTALQASPAAADATFQPTAWNGLKVYLSSACHDGNDGVPGGPCLPNYGCSGYNENTQSFNIASRAAIGTGTGMNLVERGYRARVGDGTLSANISNSNAWGSNLHMPLHSNAFGNDNCTSAYPASSFGTHGLYRDSADANCASWVAQKVGTVSPGTNDTTSYRTDLGELNANAPTCYFESEFHIWGQGASFLTNHLDWTYKIGATADAYFGR